MDSDAPPPEPARRLPRLRWVWPAALLGWIVPGLGQLWAGQPRKALLFAVAILGTFGIGWWLTDFTVVDPDRYKLDFFAQMFLGGPVAYAMELGRDRTLDAMPRFFDIGRLYVQVAGLLNLVAMADAVGDVIRRNRQILARREIEATPRTETETLPEPLELPPAMPPADPHRVEEGA